MGAIKAGVIRIGYSGGSSENIIESKLYQPGSVGVVTVSGGMSNEVYSIVNKNTDGVNAVSYTHLDVYKRQIRARSRRTASC